MGVHQVLRMPPGLEQRLLTLFRDRILPVATQSLRQWKKGVRIAGSLIARCIAQRLGCHAQEHNCTCSVSSIWNGIVA